MKDLTKEQLYSLLASPDTSSQKTEQVFEEIERRKGEGTWTQECRFCGREYLAKPSPKTPEEFVSLAHITTFFVGTSLASDVCEDKNCQAALQHECDDFDAYRKGEF